jgi:hypothetical protein
MLERKQTAIADAMLERKRSVLADALEQGPAGDPGKILTNCPSCIQGLGRQQHLGARPVHLAVELARLAGGDRWEQELVESLKHSVILSF